MIIWNLAIVRVNVYKMLLKVAYFHEIALFYWVDSGFARCAQFDQLSLQYMRNLLLKYGQTLEKKHYRTCNLVNCAYTPT
jgi:hypothetical protein